MESYEEYLIKLEDEARKNNIPFRGEFEFTPYCNLKCFFCYVSNDYTRCEKSLTTEQWLKIIRDAVSAGMVKATFTGGEVLSRYDFKEIYNKTYDMGVRILILTNGLLVNDKIIEILKKRPPEGISMTIYGASNMTYKKVCNVNNGFDNAMKAIKLMHDNKLPLSLKVPAIPDVYDDIYKIKKIVDEYNLKTNVIRYFSPMRNFKNKDNMEWRLDADKILEFINLFEDENEQKEKRRYDLYNPFNSCNIAKGRFAVSYDGKLMGCLSYTEATTDILELGFVEALKKLRSKIKKIKSYCKECEFCNYVKTCSKCPGLNYAETSSIEQCSQYRKMLAKNKII